MRDATSAKEHLSAGCAYALVAMTLFADVWLAVLGLPNLSARTGSAILLALEVYAAMPCAWRAFLSLRASQQPLARVGVALAMFVTLNVIFVLASSAAAKSRDEFWRVQVVQMLAGKPHAIGDVAFPESGATSRSPLECQLVHERPMSIYFGRLYRFTCDGRVSVDVSLSVGVVEGGARAWLHVVEG
jgi:hypothetical protein